MSARLRRPFAPFVLALGTLIAACSTTRAALEVSLDGAAEVTPLVFHGNCLVGWTLQVGLLVAETAGENVLLNNLSFQVDDAGTGRMLGGGTLDAAALRERFGEDALQLRGEESLLLPVSVRLDQAQRDPVLVTGEVRGDDGKGSVRSTFRLTADEVTVGEPPAGGGGACQPQG